MESNILVIGIAGGTGSVVIRNSANDADMIRLSHLLLESE